MDAANKASTTAAEMGTALTSSKKFSFKQDGTTAKSLFTVPVKKFYPNV
jgi:hypothetical protein